MLGPGLAFRLRGIPLQGPLDTGHPDHWLSQSHHCKPLSKCRGAGHFPWLPPVSLPTPLATTEGQSSENKAIPAQESQDPASRPALPQGAVWPWTSHWASLGHNFPMGIWTGSVREFGLGQWRNLNRSVFFKQLLPTARARWQGWRAEAEVWVSCPLSGRVMPLPRESLHNGLLG